MDKRQFVEIAFAVVRDADLIGMIDGYAHLKMTAPDPLADLQARMAAAEIAQALIVETWSGDNRDCLQRLIASPQRQFRLALCFRPERRKQLLTQLTLDSVLALRVKTDELKLLGELGPVLEATGKWLLPHAELGIGALTRALHIVLDRHPQLNLYVPHLAWPARNGQPDADWPAAIALLRQLPSVVVGISAIAHFSRETFPHSDVERWAETLITKFKATDIVAASDYPLFAPPRYTDYMRLAENWIRRIHPQWSPRLAESFAERNER